MVEGDGTCSKQIARRFRAEYEKMQQRLQESLKELPNDKEIPELLTSISSIANQNQLEVKKFQPGSEVAKGFYAEVPVVLTLTGRYLDIGKIKIVLYTLYLINAGCWVFYLIFVYNSTQADERIASHNMCLFNWFISYCINHQ